MAVIREPTIDRARVDLRLGRDRLDLGARDDPAVDQRLDDRPALLSDRPCLVRDVARPALRLGRPARIRLHRLDVGDLEPLALPRRDVLA